MVATSLFSTACRNFLAMARFSVFVLSTDEVQENSEVRMAAINIICFINKIFN
jgi:hypothetical protein